MNKAKAYRQLRKRNECPRQIWGQHGARQSHSAENRITTESSSEQEEQMKVGTVQEKHEHLLKLRHGKPLKALLAGNNAERDDDDDLEFLPSVRSCFKQLKPPTSTLVAPLKTLDLNNRPETTKTTTKGYTLAQLRAKQSTSGPVKRKASRSYSSCSSSFRGKRQPAFQANQTTCRDENHAMSNRKETQQTVSIKFPAASKMRQLLLNEKPIEPTAMSFHLNSPLQSAAIRQTTNSAGAFYPLSYTIPKQKSMKITTSQNPCAQSYPLPSSNASKRIDMAVRKQVSFIEKNDTSKSNSFDPFQSAGVLTLTTQNLELYNSMSITAQLSTPSHEDDRILEWIKQRQTHNRTGVLETIYDDIPEVEEEKTPNKELHTTESSVSSI